MASSDEERDDFVVLGKPLPDIEDEESKKPTTIQDLTARDKQGRQRFHGAFTGGFSAGYFNTVGTKEGFQPAVFVSSKKRKNDDTGTVQSAMPEDFMDEEDLEEHGIAPRKFATAGSFTSEERKRIFETEAKKMSGPSSLDFSSFLGNLQVSDQLTVGIKLLRKMGWKEGQGLGPRIRQKKKKKKGLKSKPGVKTYGCALPPSEEESNSEDEFVPEDMSSVTFAPKDVTPIPLKAKDNLHGLGYHGLDPTLALPGSHVNLFGAPAVRSKSVSKGISGQAFGVGAFEDDDDDIYTVDNMSNYDLTMQVEEDGDNKFGWTAPRQHGKQSVPVTYVGKLLEGFGLSKKQLKPKKKFPAPELPRGFKPHHWFRNKREVSHIPENLRGGSDVLTPRSTNMSAVDRGVMLGETPIMSSVFDLIPKEGLDRIGATKEAISMSKSLVQKHTGQDSHLVDTCDMQQVPKPLIHQATSMVDAPSMVNSFMSRFKPAELTLSNMDTSHGQRKSDVEIPIENTPTLGSKTTPLFQAGLSFQPFRKNPEKQKRYDQYLSFLKQGVKEPYSMVADPHMTEWERASERDEFSKAAKIYRPMSAMMSSRFVSGSMIDDDVMGTPLERDLSTAQTEVGDEVKAAEMKMFGKLTREEFEWHPHQLLCKRFNIANPYPGSDIVGVPGVKRDKYSVFNFLSMGDFQAGDSQEPSTSTESHEPDKNEPPERSMNPNRKKKTTMASVFKVLDDPNFHRPTSSGNSDTPKTSETPKSSSEQVTSYKQSDEAKGLIEEVKENEEPVADLDLFRAIFKNSDSEDSDEQEKSSSDNEGESDEEKDEEGEKTVLQERPGDDRNGRSLNKNLHNDPSTCPKEVLHDGSGTSALVDVKSEHLDNDGDGHHPFSNLFKRKTSTNSLNSAASMDQGHGFVSAAENTPEDLHVTHGIASATTPRVPEAASKSQPCREWKSRWGNKSVFAVLDDVVPQSTNGRDAEANARLAPANVNDEKEDNEVDASAYGPSLPPASAAIDNSTDLKERGRTSERNQHRKESRSSPRKEKKKKSKHKKDKKHRKHKKSSKSRSKSRKRHSRTGSEADSESDSDDSVSDSDLLQRLREISKGSKPFK